MAGKPISFFNAFWDQIKSLTKEGNLGVICLACANKIAELSSDAVFCLLEKWNKSPHDGHHQHEKFHDMIFSLHDF